MKKKANMNVNCELFFVSTFRNCFCESLMRTKAHKKFDGYHKYAVHVGENIFLDNTLKDAFQYGFRL